MDESPFTSFEVQPIMSSSKPDAALPPSLCCCSPSSSSYHLPTSFNISSLFTVPMDRTNYLSWKSQFEDILEMHGLTAIVKNNTEPPKVQEDGSVHPEFAKDKLVLSWIKATSSSSIKTLLIPCTTANQAWNLLAKRLSPLASTRVRILRDQIRTLRKDNNTTVTDYLNYAKSLVDSLMQSGATMDDDEFISYVLDGLGLEYKELATTLHLHPDINFDQFYDLALREEHLQKRMSLTLTTGVAMAADRIPDERSFNSKLPNHNHTNFGRNRGRNWNQGRGSRRTGQWEQNQGIWSPNRHSQRREPSFEGRAFDSRSPHHVLPPPATLSDGRPPLLPTPHGSSLNTQRSAVLCFRCDKPGHIARFCPDRQPPQHQAYMAEHITQFPSRQTAQQQAYMAENFATSPSLTADVANQNWCLDSGATHHMTANASSLPDAQPYTGQQNGEGTSYWQ